MGGEDGISTSRPLKDGGREAWDMMRRLREKAWLKAGLDPSVLWTEQAQAQVCSSRKSKGGDNGLGVNIKSFADGYYAMLKEGYDAQNQQEVTRRGHQPPLSTGSVWGNIDTTMTDLNSMSNSAQPVPAENAKPPLWPSHLFPDFSNLPSFSPFPYSPGQQEIPDILGQAKNSPATTAAPTSNTSTDTTLFPPSSSLNPGVPALQAQPRQQQRQQPLPPFSQPLTTPPNLVPSPDPSTLNANVNVNFDWDQWDAVFGEYLPVVDGFMDLDGPGPSPPAGASAAGHQRQVSQQVRSHAQAGQAQHRRTQSQMVQRSMGSVSGMSSGFMEKFGFDGVQDGGFKNWADFG